MANHCGCYTDKVCTDTTCMRLPAGHTCGDCVHVTRCAMFGHTQTDTYCDWFPKRFRWARPMADGERKGGLL